MKKYIFVIAFAVFSAAFSSCSKSETYCEEQNVDQNLVPISFSTSITKTALEVSGSVGTVKWVNGDEVSLYYLGNDGETPKDIVLTAQVEGETVVLTGAIPAEDNPDHFYATYPKDKGTLSIVEQNEKFEFTIANGDGSFAKANQMAAYTTADSKNLQFKHAVGLIKVPVPTNGIVSHAGKDYTIKSVRFKDVGGNIPCTGKSTVTVTDGVVSGFSAPTTLNSNATISSAQMALGYAYIPVYGGTCNEGFIIQYVSKDGEISAFGDIPAIKTKNTATLTVNRGDIKELFSGKNPFDYVVWDYYVSNDGTGDGKTPEAPMSYDSFKTLMGNVGSWCQDAALNGTTFHFKAETFSTYSNGAPITIPASGATFKTTFQGGWQGAEHAKTVWSGANGAAAAKQVFVVNNGIRLYVKDFQFEYGKAANGGALDLGAAKAPQSDDDFLFDCEDCIFCNNTTNANGIGGSVLVRAGAKGGVVRFNNCLFNGSKAATNGISIASNGAASIFCNNCTFMEALPNNICTYIYMNGAKGKLGVNNCTFKTDGADSKISVDKNNAMVIVCLGYSAVANSTFWTAKGFGKLGFAGYGCTKANEGSDKGALYVNCMFKNTCTDATPRYSFYLTDKYNIKIDHCLYNRINTNTASTPADYSITNSWVYDENSTVSDGKKNTSKTNGVAHFYYTYTTRPTTEQFTYISKADLKTAIQGVSVVGTPFHNWLTSIGAYDKDIAGAERGDELFPGSAQQTTTYNQ